MRVKGFVRKGFLQKGERLRTETRVDANVAEENKSVSVQSLGHGSSPWKIFRDGGETPPEERVNKCNPHSHVDLIPS